MGIYKHKPLIYGPKVEYLNKVVKEETYVAFFFSEFFFF